MKYNWTCTDCNQYQYARQVNDDTWEFIQAWNPKRLRRNALEFCKKLDVTETVALLPEFYYDELSLSDYTKEELWDDVAAYYSRAEFEDMYNGTGQWNSESGKAIILECVFEQSL